MKRLLAALCLLTSPLAAQWAKVGWDTASGSASGAVTLGIASASLSAHNLEICYAASDYDTLYALTDQLGNSFTALDSVLNFSGEAFTKLYYTVVTTGGAHDTMTFARGVAQNFYYSLVCAQFSGNATSTAADGHSNGTTSGGSPVSSGAYTTTTNGDLRFGAAMVMYANGGSTLTAQNLGNGVVNIGVGNNNAYTNAGWATQVSAGADSSYWTQSGSAALVATSASFKPSTGGGGGAMGWLIH